MSSKDLIALLRKHGWSEIRQKGSHKVFQHDEKKGNVVVPAPRKDYPKGTLRAILKQAGIENED